MKYKTLKGIAKLMAQFNQQDVATQEGRHIFDPKYFSEEDQKQIEVNTAAVVKVFKGANNKSNNEVLTELKEVLPLLFIGSIMQDEYIATCRHNKINIA